MNREHDCNAELCGSVSCCGPLGYERGEADANARIKKIKEAIDKALALEGPARFYWAPILTEALKL